MGNYAPQLPRDKGNAVKTQSAPPQTALSAVYKDNITASSILLLGHDTTELEITATTVPVAIKWLTQAVVDSSVAGTSVLTTVTTSNFDNVVPVGTKNFVVPIQRMGSSPSVQGVNRALGLYPAVALKGLGVGSVITVQLS